MRDPKERLRDILEALARIERYASRGREAFDMVRNSHVMLALLLGC
jgi:uncharacterized protein with HEPN domain